MPPEYGEKLMNHNSEGKASVDALLASHKKRTESRSQNLAGGTKPVEAENDLGNRLIRDDEDQPREEAGCRDTQSFALHPSEGDNEEKQEDG